jgi:DNA-binding MarR family transcriptional regulator
MLDNNSPGMIDRSAKSARKRRHEAAPERGPRAGASAVDLGILAELVGYKVRRLQLRIFQDFIETMEEHGIRPSQFSVLTVVGANPGLKQAQVCAALGIKRANLVVMLDELERRGLLQRVRGPADRRSHALHLTAAGAALQKRLDELVQRHEQRFIRKIGEDGKRRLNELLEKMLST